MRTARCSGTGVGATLVAVAGLLAGCASDGSPSPSPSPTATPAAAEAAHEETPEPASVTFRSGGGGVTVNRPVSSAATDPDAVAPELRSTSALGEIDFARTLVSADRRVDEYVSLDPEARATERRRELLASALEAFAAEHLERLLGRAADPSDPFRRLRSVKVLAFANDRRATAAAVAALGEAGDPALQAAAAFTLSRLADPDTSLDALVGAARSPDVDVRVNALLALARVLGVRGSYSNFIDQEGRDRVLDLLDTALFDPEDALARGNAAAVAGALGDPRAVDSLLNLLRDEDPFVRAHTARALGKVGNRRAIGPLVDVVDESPPGVARTSVLAALTELLVKERVVVPEDLADDERTWSEFVAKSFAEQARRPLR